MPKFHVSKRSIEDWEVVVEADNEEEVYDIIADGVEWTFIQSDDEGLVIEQVEEK